MKNNTKQTLVIYWTHARKYRLIISLIFVSIAAATTVGIVIPLYFKKFFDTLGAAQTKETAAHALISILLAVAGLEFIKWLCWRVAVYANAFFQSTVIADISSTCFKYLHKHSFTYFNNNFVGSLVKRFNWFTRAFESVMDKIIWNLLPLTINLIFITIILGQRSYVLALTLCVWTVVFLMVNWLFTNYKMQFDIKRNEAESKATALLADTITNNNNVKLFCGYSREVASYGAITDTVRKLRRLTWNLDGIFEAIQGFLVVALEIGIFYLAVRLWRKNLLTLGDFVLIQTYVIMIFNEIWNFGKLLRYLYSDLADAAEMTTILTTPHDIQDTVDAHELQITQGTIAFEQVDFNYHETRRIISRFTITIPAKQKIAFVGPSGAGKSTVVKLLLRMHDITKGKISIDDQNIIRVTQESLWKNISVVPQDPILFHRTLLENIRYGKPDATDAEVVEAAKKAHCHEFISEFSDGYSTYVGERGVKLSGGERQRVAIARAILRNAPILVLDEATSSLDSESEALIQDALNTLMRDKTVIVIAHRLSTIMKMDRIVVINQGAIVEDGTHVELLQKTGGLYRDLWRLQAGGFMHDEPSKNSEDELGHTLPAEAPLQLEEID